MKRYVFIVVNALLLMTLAFCPRPYTYDVDKTLAYLNEKAHKKSQGLCAQYVRKALEAGGCSTWGHPMCAKGYTDFLPYLNFSEVDRKNFSPQKGDIIVFDATKGHPYGHIAIWNGKQWISDFKQKSKFVAPAYLYSDSYKYYRMCVQSPWRRFTMRQHLNGIMIQPMALAAQKMWTSLQH